MSGNGLRTTRLPQPRDEHGIDIHHRSGTWHGRHADDRAAGLADDRVDVRGAVAREQRLLDITALTKKRATLRVRAVAAFGHGQESTP